MFNSILVPLDGSKLAESAVPTALQLASRFDGEVTLLRVVQPPHLMLTNATGMVYAELFATLRDQAMEEAATYLKGFQGSLQQQGYNVRTRIVEGEPVAEAILDSMVATHTNIVVMSTHGRGGLSRWVFGSVADKILQHATVPILLIRAKDDGMDWQMAGKMG